MQIGVNGLTSPKRREGWLLLGQKPMEMTEQTRQLDFSTKEQGDRHIRGQGQGSEPKEMPTSEKLFSSFIHETITLRSIKINVSDCYGSESLPFHKCYF